MIDSGFSTLMSPQDVHSLFSITRPTELAWRAKGLLPPVIRMNRKVFYRRSDVQRIINQDTPSHNGKR